MGRSLKIDVDTAKLIIGGRIEGLKICELSEKFKKWHWNRTGVKDVD